MTESGQINKRADRRSLSLSLSNITHSLRPLLTKTDESVSHPPTGVEVCSEGETTCASIVPDGFQDLRASFNSRGIPGPVTLPSSAEQGSAVSSDLYTLRDRRSTARVAQARIAATLEIILSTPRAVAIARLGRNESHPDLDFDSDPIPSVHGAISCDIR